MRAYKISVFFCDSKLRAQTLKKKIDRLLKSWQPTSRLQQPIVELHADWWAKYRSDKSRDGLAEEKLPIRASLKAITKGPPEEF